MRALCSMLASVPLALWCQGALAASGASSSDALLVGARVAAYARLEMIRHADQVSVTPEEIERGYVEVRPGARLDVRTNSREGYFVNFELDPGAVRSAEVFGLAQDASIVPGRGRTLRVPVAIPRESLELGFRFHLSPEARPGVLRWPVRIWVSQDP